MTAWTDTAAEWEIILPNRDRATATNEVGALLAARTIVAENSAGYYGNRVARELIATRDGIYNAAMTRRIQERNW